MISALPAGVPEKLGISAKSLHAARPPGDLSGRLKARRDRFDLTRHSARILYQPELAAELQHRTVWCHRAIKNQGGNATIWRRADGSSARLTGVTTCGNVWTCPVCCARVAERRKEEVEAAMKVWVGAGGRVYLLTLTFPHERDLPIERALELFAKALQRFKNSRAYKRILGSAKKPGLYKREGSIRSLEITWGSEHGWHPHTHDLVFSRPGLDSDAGAIDELKGAWISALLKSGLGDRSKLEWMWKYGLDLGGGEEAAEYIAKFGRDAKWGVSSEITRQHAKVGMRGGIGDHRHVTPFQILAWSATGDAEATHLFSEYAAAMEGSRMLYWSPGLKRRLGVDELDDQDIAAEGGPDRDARDFPIEANVASIDADALALVTSRAALGELLELVCLVSDPDPDHVQACVDDFLAALRDRAQTAKAMIRVKRWKQPGFYVHDGGRQ